jgi:lipopolysaccharide transport system ATP-binding protein
MSDTTIRVDNLGKMYRIGAAEKQSRNGWRALGDLAMSPFDYLRRMGRPPTEEETLWALRDVSFEVQRGEVVGIIGRNGAGKTTLLKILSRITEPTEGYAEIHGRVGSLLEVGTGFHPELTGRENIYLNGAILGMRKVEIDRKFDEIVAFAEIEKFMDTPVKRYSSGMYVRLAFAVAAHLEPEILLVDEVLAVGDAAFQKKGLGKMGDVAREGRTVLFVSHNMGAIQSLCERCLLLNDGHLILDDEATSTVETYLANLLPTAITGSLEAQIPGLCVKSITLDEKQLEHGFNKPLKFDLHFTAEKDFYDLRLVLQIVNSLGARISNAKVVIPRLEGGDSVVSIVVMNHYLPPGHYALNLVIHRFDISILMATNAFSFEISEIGIDDPFLVSRRDKIGACVPARYHVQRKDSSQPVSRRDNH